LTTSSAYCVEPCWVRYTLICPSGDGTKDSAAAARPAACPAAAAAAARPAAAIGGLVAAVAVPKREHDREPAVKHHQIAR